MSVAFHVGKYDLGGWSEDDTREFLNKEFPAPIADAILRFVLDTQKAEEKPKCEEKPKSCEGCKACCCAVPGENSGEDPVPYEAQQDILENLLVDSAAQEPVKNKGAWMNYLARLEEARMWLDKIIS